MFGFLFLVALVLAISCAEVTVVAIYLHLCNEVCTGEDIPHSAPVDSHPGWLVFVC
jgi:hypothetical protein